MSLLIEEITHHNVVKYFVVLLATYNYFFQSTVVFLYSMINKICLYKNFNKLDFFQLYLKKKNLGVTAFYKKLSCYKIKYRYSIFLILLQPNTITNNVEICS